MNKYTPSGSVPRLCLDILKQPHTLIAGTTGSGKSVLMNSIIYTAMYKSPAEAGMIFIDTKGSELYKYRNIPHCWYYADTPEKAVRTLSAVIKTIEERFKRARKKGLSSSDEADLYIFIDELGDLIYTDRAAVKLLGRIAMIGRAANVHLIAGTQCPNRKTLSPEFAANCAARVGLRCRDRIESRQIIARPDCIDLPEYGSGYYLSPQLLEPVLVDIPYTPQTEIDRVVKHWHKQR